MIKTILDRLALVDGAAVREGFYSHAVARENKFIFLQPYTSNGEVTGAPNYKEDLVVQLVAGIKLPNSNTPTADLVNLVRDIRRLLFKGERQPQKPSWLSESKTYAFKESEVCKFIMPEAHEQHGLAVLTLSISTSPTFDDQL